MQRNLDPELTTAIELARAGDKVGATRLLMQVAHDEPDNELAWYWLAWCAKNRKDRLHALERVLEINPGNAKAQAEWEKLTNAAGRGKYTPKRRYRKTSKLEALGRTPLSFWGASGLAKMGTGIMILVDLVNQTVKDLFSAPSRSYSPPRSNALPSGYSRSEYHYYGATDDDIEYWGLDQPGAPAPWDAGIAVWEVLDEMDADGDGLMDDPWDDPFT